MSGFDKRRIFVLLLLLVAGLGGVAGRLFWIQLVSAESYSSRGIDLVKNSVLQRQHALVLESGRGSIADRRLQPMTGSWTKALVVFPVQAAYQGSEAQIATLAAALQTTPEAWRAFAGGLQTPQLWSGPPSSSKAAGTKIDGAAAALSERQAAQIAALQLPYLRLVDYESRYPAAMGAKQLIGFIGENPERIKQQFADELAGGRVSLASKIGGSGLEKTFESWLRGIGETSISSFTDAAKRPLDGLNTRLIQPDNGYYPLRLVTTLDLDIQRQIEVLMDKLHIQEGSAVVLDAEQADVIAMASRPDFQPDQVDLLSGNWRNHALKAIEPGSIFKTVVAAAALEEHVVDAHETFDCEGALGKYGFTCWKKDGHGPLTLEEGFAQSCNIVFAEVMRRLDASRLEQYAQKLGLLSQVGWSGTAGEEQSFRQFDAEEPGQLFAKQTPTTDEGALLQTAIGQRDVLVSPLQAANMVVTLLHGGQAYSPRIVQEIQFKTGQVMERFAVSKLDTGPGAVLPQTSKKLLSWMEEVVTDGTGQALRSAVWRLAGKSGTAQVQRASGETVNQWFIGYGPVDAPRYAVAVAVEHMAPNAKDQAIPLFKGIMDILAAASAPAVSAGGQ